MHRGENFGEAITRAIRASKVMVLVFSASANNSDEIKKEVVLAGRIRVPVIPLRVEEIEPRRQCRLPRRRVTMPARPIDTVLA